MNNIPIARQEQIMRWLAEENPLSIDELARRLNVSSMTVHRDVDALVRLGQVTKVHGGVKLGQSTTQSSPQMPICRLCNSPIPERTSVILNLPSGETLEACCPHCGLMLAESKQPTSILMKDFIYGRIVNGLQAAFLVGCEIKLCCVPSVICFASMEDATRFQMGFGGCVMSFAEAQHTLVNDHRKVVHEH